MPYVFVAPIVLAAWYWSARAAMVISLAAGFLCGPLMYLNSWTDTLQPWSVIIVRTVIFMLFGIGIGLLLERMKEKNDSLQRAGTELIKTLAHTIELRDAYTNGHCERVAKMAVTIGKELHLSTTQLLYLEWAALIHDIGKIGVPEDILNKTDKLTDAEFAVIKRHPNLGAWALKASEVGQHMRDGVLHHHERWDGKGYPYGQSGENIPLQGRIIAVPDVWDAITSERSYRKEMAREDSIQMMKDGRGTQFDPEILDIFLRLLDKHPEW
ncbi:HD domain-containing protein [Alicyclobacillus curvatus]|nr:HD domain-containing protein [Alicyclobacillus curvatus]